MWADMFPGETAAALQDRIDNPVPTPAPRPSLWSSAADLITSPLTGIAEGINESLRVANRFASAGNRRQAERYLDADTYQRRMDEARRAELAGKPIDEALRHGAEYWRVDPATANWASQFLHNGARVVTKVAGYSLVGGLPGGAIGTGIDEGATNYMQLRDQGVDPETAAKVGVVHGALTGAGAALPIAGRTLAESAGLWLLGGPGSYMTETALSRRILEDARYPDLAAQFDPFDVEGLALSMVPGAALGAAAHMGRARAARARAGEAPPVAGERVQVSPQEAVDAAHVQLQTDAIDGARLARADDPQGAIAHSRALDEARASLDEGRQPALPEVHADDARVRTALENVAQRLRAADVPALVAEQRAAAREPLGTEPLVATDPAASRARFAEDGAPASGEAAAPQTRPEVQRALEVASTRPDMPVRLEDDGSPARPAAELIRDEAQQAARETAESINAVQAAVQCFLRLGGE